MKVLLCLWSVLLGWPTIADIWKEAAPSARVIAAELWERDIDLQCLRDAYPSAITAVESDIRGRTWLIVQGRTPVLFDGESGMGGMTGCAADVRATLRQLYPLEPERPPTPEGMHPGRIRSYALLHALYGADRTAVRARLIRIPLLRQQVVFSSSAGADEALRRVAAALRILVARRPELAEYIVPAGGFNWRLIQGETLLSPHSFGIAIDLNPRKGPYWRWSKMRRHPLQDSYPTEIVRIFEDNGFVWGGKWREYDLMHFEYRPEIICKSRRLQERTARRARHADGMSVISGNMK